METSPNLRSCNLSLQISLKWDMKFLKEYSIRFLMVSRLTDFAFVVLKLVLFNVCGIIAIKNGVFQLFWFWKGYTKLKKIKTIRNFLNLQVKHFSSSFNKIRILFWFITDTLPFLLLYPTVRVVNPICSWTAISRKW